MKITLIIPTFIHGGMERVMSELANHWSEKGFHIDIIFLVKHEPFFNISERVNSVIMPHFTYKQTPISKFMYSIRLMKSVRNKIKQIRPDAILSFGEGYNSFVLLCTLGLKVDVFVSDRSNPFKKQNYFRTMYQKLLYPKAKGILAQTSLAKEELYKKTKHTNIFVIPNPTKSIPKINVKQENIILNVGRLVPEKDQLTLIRIFSKVHFDDWKLYIIGDGPLKPVLNKEIERFELEGFVRLVGVEKDLSPYFSKSKIFALTSISEGYPNALCEAMAFPMPCISFDCNAGPRDIIENNVNGILIDQGSEDEYAEKLLGLMTSEALRNNIKSNAIKIRESHSIDFISERILAAFKSTPSQ